MKLTSKKFEYYDEPVAVYDVTNKSGNDNFVLANGLVVHNCMEASKDKINNNAEVVGLLAALGVDLTSSGPVNIPYGKVICLADADVDGDHITVLLLGLLWKYLPALYKQGKVFVVKAPLYKCRYKNQIYFGMTKEEIYKQTKTTNVDVTYIKGWGELSEGDLGVAIDPGLRKLYQINSVDKDGSLNMQLLLGKQPAFRKKLLGVQ